MTINDLIFIGRGGWAMGLHRDSGQIVWHNDQMNSGYTTLLLDGDRLIVSTNGYLYCLDPLTGVIQWQNPLRGYGVGVTTLASVRGETPPGDAVAMAADEESRRQNDSSDSNSST